MTNLKTKILETVQKNNIRMIPRWKFVLYSSLGVIGIAFAFLMAVFIFSLILFVLSRYGFMYMPLFGFMETLHTLTAVPLFLVICTVLLLIIIELISRHYAFSFRRPLAITLLLITSLVTVISFLISLTPVHEYIRDYAKEHKVPLMGKVYDRPLPFKERDGMTVIRGSVLEVATGTAVLRMFDGKTLTIYASSTASSSDVLTEGEDVIAIGTLLDNRFEFVAIRKAPVMPFGKEKGRGGFPRGEKRFDDEMR